MINIHRFKEEKKELLYTHVNLGKEKLVKNCLWMLPFKKYSTIVQNHIQKIVYSKSDWNLTKILTITASIDDFFLSLGMFEWFCSFCITLILFSRKYFRTLLDADLKSVQSLLLRTDIGSAGKMLSQNYVFKFWKSVVFFILNFLISNYLTIF